MQQISTLPTFRRFCGLVVALLAAVSPLVVRAQSVEEQYLRVYGLIQEGDRLETAGQAAEARSRFQDAQAGLRKIQAEFPNWNQGVVRFRLRHVDNRLGNLAAPGAPSVAVAPGGVEPRPATAPGETRPSSAEQELRNQLQNLQALLQRTDAEKNVLEMKLREALTAQPAAVDPRELARAHEQLRQLQKEKDVLLASLEQERARRARLVEPAALEDAQNALAAAGRQLAEQRDAAAALQKEKEILESRLKQLSGREASSALRAENESLRRQLQERGGSPEAAERTARLDREMAEARAALESNARALAEARDGRALAERSRAELEKQLAAVTRNAQASEKTAADRIRRLERQVSELESDLRRSSRRARPGDRTEPELASLRARLSVLEAEKIPYTAEELALFKAPAVATAVRPVETVPAAPVPPPENVAPLLAEAERAFASRRYSDAEQRFNEALRLDANNATTLANLAAAQIEQEKYDAAEATLNKVLPAAPNDAYALSLMGILRFRQARYDDAFETLSRAAQADPQNPEVQNYLGITLSQKGQRAAAETALRRAIAIAPGYASAHHNLAVIYATQTPPFLELARWHYDKALVGGHPKNPEVEKLLEPR